MEHLRMHNSPAGGVRAVDHVGYVVTDLDAALRFFVEHLGFREIDRRGVMGEPEGERMTRLFGVHPRATCRFQFVALGDAQVELLEWDAPEHSAESPSNADAGGRHLALTVDDIDATIARLHAQPGITVRERNDRGFYYMGTPFGLEIQLIPA
jgi:catechol 2,3-dioxygenase-like lactoylglutathione lyase family enzyme